MVIFTLFPGENTRRLHHYLHPQRIVKASVRKHIQGVPALGRVDVDCEGQLERCRGGVEGHLRDVAWNELCVGSSELSTGAVVQLPVVAPYEVAAVAGLAAAECCRLRVRCGRCLRLLAERLELPEKYV